MAQRNKEHRDKHDPNKQGDKDKNNNANKREMFIRVPSNDVRVMPGAQVYLCLLYTSPSPRDRG